ncbi:MAG: gamma-glutamylcyclotransferase [Planctomycetes bacterium]|nr:gamma-glutamylcyclotransferase [Planctomycetota bacterium]MCB9869812.1 gamma-glutamylcyclotransferase [Planctomycetota bacterium]
MGQRLAAYGTLRPGEPNHAWLAGLAGSWEPGVVHGRLDHRDGYPVLTPDKAGEPISVMVFTSLDLPGHWDRLDRLEGANYRRAPVRVTYPDGRSALATAYVAR